MLAATLLTGGRVAAAGRLGRSVLAARRALPARPAPLRPGAALAALQHASGRPSARGVPGCASSAYAQSDE